MSEKFSSGKKKPPKIKKNQSTKQCVNFFLFEEHPTTAETPPITDTSCIYGAYVAC